MVSKLPANFGSNFWKNQTVKAVQQAPKPSQNLNQKLGTVNIASSGPNTINLTTASIIFDGEDEAVTVPTTVPVYPSDRVLLEKRSNVWIVVGNLSSTPARGLIAQGMRTTSSAASTGPAVIVSVLRLDNLSLKANRAYLMTTGNIRPSVNPITDKAKVELRYNASGVATTASNEIGRSELQSSATGNNFAQVTGWVIPAVDTTNASLLMSFVKTVTAGTATLSANTTEPLWLQVFDMGPAVANTGISL